ncbi:pyridoxal-phosphate-dependent aminotransferase family protein [Fluviibacterium sp. S390]|uniref:pyridoxal-phosphate-dependent aminotransferase family protein n=1 Tax=Fluviibacterium sp. S390 TaxID=3415139 RepID=UPI003C7D396A
MSLSQGRSYLAIPGPSVLPDRVLQAMQRPAPNIYTGELVGLVDSLLPDLKAVARTEGKVAIYICNGHGLWDATLANLVTPCDRLLVLSTGRFAVGWGDAARAMGAEVDVMDFGLRGAMDPERVEAALRADTGHRIKSVLVAHVDTATSVRNDIAALRRAMDAAGHPALLLVDCIASLGCDPFEMDAWGVDVMIAASQKGLMTPPGLGFVFFNDRADLVRKGLDRVPRYWDWTPRTEAALFYQLFCGTAPTHHLFALREALTMLVHEEGLTHALARHATLARCVWAAAEAWQAGGGPMLNIAERGARSHAVTALTTVAVADGTRLRDWMEQQAGVTLGIGLGMVAPGNPEWHRYFRIGHMGHVNAHMVLGVLASLQAGLVALDIPHGTGALDAAARVCAGASG